jgi:hypothetical protein
MKYKVDSLEGMDESISSLYKKDGEGFVLTVEGMPEQEDVAGLKSSNAKLLQEKRDAKAAQDLAVSDAAEAARVAATKSGDVEALTSSWQTKYDDLQSRYDASTGSLNGTIADLTSGAAAIQLASKLAVENSAEVLLPHIKSRLKTELVDGVPKLVVLDKEGKPSAFTLEDLSQEFQNNKAFAHVIIGSKAQGAGLDKGTGGAGGASKVSRADFDAMAANQRMAHVKAGGTVTDEAA